MSRRQRQRYILRLCTDEDDGVSSEGRLVDSPPIMPVAARILAQGKQEVSHYRFTFADRLRRAINLGKMQIRTRRPIETKRRGMENSVCYVLCC